MDIHYTTINAAIPHRKWEPLPMNISKGKVKDTEFGCSLAHFQATSY